MDLGFWIAIVLAIAAVLLSPWYYRMIASLMGQDQVPRERDLEERRVLIESLGAVAPHLEQFLRLAPDNKKAAVETGQVMDAVYSARAEFGKNHYSLWRLQRRRTIDKLGELREKLDEVSKYVNISKSAGSTTSILGSMGMIVSQYIPAASRYLIIASSMRLIGNVLVPASDYLESLISNDYINDLKEIVKQDQALTEQLRYPLIQARKLNENFSQLFKCSFLSDQEDMQNALTNAVQLHDSLARGVEIGLRENPGNVYNRETLSTIQEMMDSYKCILEKLQNPRVYKMCKSSVELVMAIRGLGYTDIIKSFNLTGLRNLLQHGCNDNLANLCLKEAPNVVHHCISLNTSIRIAFQGKSDYHEPLKVLEEDLNEELGIIEEIIPMS